MGSRNKHANCRQSNPRKATNSPVPFGMLRLDGALDTIPMHDRYSSHQMASITDSHVYNQSFGQRKDLEVRGCQNVSLRYPKRYRATAVQNGAMDLEHACLFPTYEPKPQNSHTLCEFNSVPPDSSTTRINGKTYPPKSRSTSRHSRGSNHQCRLMDRHRSESSPPVYLSQSCQADPGY